MLPWLRTSREFARDSQGLRGHLRLDESDYSAIAGYTAADDVCDGIDSNCNGVADEDVVLPTADKTAGVCRGLTKVCAGAAGLVEPNYGDLVDYAGTDSVCDGLDNDCDGLIDEDLGDAPLADTN